MWEEDARPDESCKDGGQQHRTRCDILGGFDRRMKFVRHGVAGLFSRRVDRLKHEDNRDRNNEP